MTVHKFPNRGKAWREAKRWLLETRDPATGNPPPRTWVEEALWAREPIRSGYPVFTGWDLGVEESPTAQHKLIPPPHE